MLQVMAASTVSQFMDTPLWNQEARETYLQALKGDEHVLEAEGSARQDNA
jgi:hypothetical protein